MEFLKKEENLKENKDFLVELLQNLKIFTDVVEKFKNIWNEHSHRKNLKGIDRITVKSRQIMELKNYIETLLSGNEIQDPKPFINALITIKENETNELFKHLELPRSYRKITSVQIVTDFFKQRDSALTAYSNLRNQCEELIPKVKKLYKPEWFLLSWKTKYAKKI